MLTTLNECPKGICAAAVAAEYNKFRGAWKRKKDIVCGRCKIMMAMMETEKIREKYGKIFK